jgi:hypothetical protein
VELIGQFHAPAPVQFMVRCVHGSSGRGCELINLFLTAVKSAAGLFTGGVSILNNDDDDDDDDNNNN